MSPATRCLVLGLLTASAAAVLKVEETGAETGHEKGHEKGHEMGHEKGHEQSHEMGRDKDVSIYNANHTGQQTPEELGFTSDGDVDESAPMVSRLAADFCLDLGAKGFPLDVFKMLQGVDWDARKYFEQLQAKGIVEEALQMTGPQGAMLKSDCMKDNFKGKIKHIFVGDSQMMSLRNAFHRLNKCPEIWWDTNVTHDALRQASKFDNKMVGRLHSPTRQTPEAPVTGCKESGIASFIYWDAWAHRELPVDQIQKEIQQLGLEPKEGDTVVAWVGSNYIQAARRMGILTDTIDKMLKLGVKLVWDSPTFQDAAIMTAASTHDQGRDPHNGIPITHTHIQKRKQLGTLGSDQYKTEKALYKSGIEIPVTRRWQLTNRYRGLQCDGMHTDMRARDPAFYEGECPGGNQRYGHASGGCNWVEGFRNDLAEVCPVATGLDDLVLQSGLYSICAAHERPFCYMHREDIR